MKWVFKIKLEPSGRERLKSRIFTKGYQQVPGVEFTEKLSPVTTGSTSMQIIIRIPLQFLDEYDWVREAFDIEEVILDPYLDINVHVMTR